MTPEHLVATLREFALSFPEAWEDHPWGETVIKVGKKVFVFLGQQEHTAFVTTKLPQSNELALGFPFTSPTGYGLGRSGWITSRFDPDDEPPIDTLEAWIDESYRAVAPKKLVKELDGANNT